MRMSRSGMLTLVLLMAVGWSRPCAGESMLFNGRGVIYGGIGAGYYLNSLDEEDTHSKRFAFMSSYGLTRWMDVFAQVGVADLKIEGHSGRTDFQGEYEGAIGAGVRVRLLGLFGSRVLLYGEGCGCLFPSKGKVSQGAIQSTVDYDWLEGEAALGIEFPSLGCYAGAQGSWVETKADRRSYLIEDEVKTYIRGYSETYRSGARWSGFVGKIFPLRSNFRLDIRVTGPEMASIRIALTQLYQPEEDPF